MSYTITRREFVGALAALPLLGKIEQPQDTFDMTFSDDFPPIVAECFANGRVVITHDGERWASEDAERGYATARSRRPDNCITYRYAPEKHQFDIVMVVLKRPLTA
jgi:hypothetical protein